LQMAQSLKSESIKTSPIDGQKAGTSGLRKPTKVFTSENYLENFIQATLSALGDSLVGSKLVLGGDGRYFCDVAAGRIVEICAGNGVSEVFVGQNGILSTPSVSCVIRKRQLTGGIVLTASHNPGGPDNDFGVKFNVANGGPAPESFTDKIYANTRSIAEYRVAKGASVDLSKLGRTEFTVDGKPFVVEVIDSVADYEELMSSIFDFDRLREFIAGGTGCSVLANPLHGVMGPYVKRLLCQRLGVSESQAVNCVPLPDFGGGHPDPNLTYAAELVNAMRSGSYDLGLAFDGDGDRNMILGKSGFFVTPCDSLAVLAANLECIPYFKRTGVNGFARSMPTSGAVDLVAKRLGLKCYEVPTGWKFFGNLMDAKLISLCGEESFGTGSDHIREKDGLWAALAWLSVLADKRASVEDIVKAHWAEFGRNFYTRYDYENVTSESANQLMTDLQSRLSSLPGVTLTGGGRSYTVASADNFSYKDPVDASVTSNQGVRVVFSDGSRIIYRLSGTGSSGATIRVYIEQYEAAGGNVLADPAETLRPLVEVALSLSRMAELTGRDAPTVIT
ncbi:hypothetical protein BOX15_Mlig002733g1, partial [Macrostomum lignano]